MAKSYIVYDYEQEEIIEKQLIAGEDGVVTEQEVMTQGHLHVWIEARYSNTQNSNTNTSTCSISFWAHILSNSGAVTFTPSTLSCYVRSTSYDTVDYDQKESGTAEAGEELELYWGRWRYSDNDFTKLHNYDGTADSETVTTGGSFRITGGIGGIFEDKDYHSFSFSKSTFEGEFEPTNRGINIITANSFTDEENAEFSYELVAHKTTIKVYDYSTKSGYDVITGLQAALSLDGVTPIINYRSIPIENTTYTFVLTEEEREKIREATVNVKNAPIYYLVKVNRTLYKNYNMATVYKTGEFNTEVERVLTIAGCEPTLNPTVKDINARTVYLTGDANKFVKYCSIAEFTTGAAASKYATIVSQSVINGTHTVENLSSGTIEEVDSNTFYFSVTDSRNLTTKDFIVVDLVPYIKLTSRISKATLDTDGVLKFTVTGNYYNGSFGAVDNSLEFEYSIKEEGGDTTWHIIEPTPSFNGNTYTIEHAISGLDYQKRYTITVNIIDEVTSIQTEPKVISAIPVFDWSAEDFNHNTKVNFNEDIEIAEGKNIIGNVNINGFAIGNNKLLWSGASHMNGNQSINLSEAISAQTNGIVLVFSLYRNGAAENVSINTAFVSKYEVAAMPDAPHTFWMAVNAGFSIIGAKYLYIDDTTIKGHEGNTSSGANSGITFNNSNYVLRYVIGV